MTLVSDGDFEGGFTWEFFGELFIVIVDYNSDGYGSDMLL